MNHSKENEIPKVSLEDLWKAPENYQGQKILIRGFLYPEENHFVMALEPNLKTCCRKKDAHIYVELDETFLISESKAYTLQGIVEGDKIWKLKDSKVILETYNYLFLIPIGVSALIAIICAKIWLRKKSRF